MSGNANGTQTHPTLTDAIRHLSAQDGHNNIDIWKATQAVLTNPELGPEHVERILADKGITLKPPTAEDFDQALRVAVQGDPLLTAYVDRLTDLAKAHPEVQADPEAIAPTDWLEQLAMKDVPEEPAFTQPDVPAAEPNGRSVSDGKHQGSVVDTARLHGLL